MPDVERMSLTDLTARTATADSDLLHINSGGTDYKEQKSDFCKDIVQYVELSNQSSITSQVDTLAGSVKSPSFYAGKINSYGSGPATVTGAPVANSGHLLISIYSGSYVRIEFTEVDGQCRSYVKFKQGGTWDSQWTQLPSRAEITSINNSLTKSSGTISPANNYGTISSMTCNKVAGIVTFSFLYTFATQSTAQSGEKVIATFPAGFRPPSLAVASIQSNTSIIEYCYVDANGYMFVNSGVINAHPVSFISGSFAV